MAFPAYSRWTDCIPNLEVWKNSAVVQLGGERITVAGSMIRRLAGAYQRLFARPCFYEAHVLALRIACKGLGMLNSNPNTNGEFWFLATYGPAFRVILDVGANTGQFAERALISCPNASIYCFEPHPKSVEALLRRFRSESRVRVVDKAIGCSSGRAHLFDHADQQGSEHATLVRGVIEHIHQASVASVQVDEIPLDEFVAQEHLDRVDFIKIDVEGSEGAVLRGAATTIGEFKPAAIQLEFNDMNLLSKYTIIDLVNQLSGYKLYRLLPRALVQLRDPWRLENKVYAYQNLIALRRDAFHDLKS